MAKVTGPSARLLRVSTTRLDGGPVFGSVLKEQWEIFMPPDRQNRVAFGNYSMLLQHESGWILVDTGPGDKDPISFDVAPVRSRSSLIRDLRELGISPRDIAMVVLTHLRSEHAGGATHCTSSGRVLPTFPRARYVVQRSAWEEACQPSERHQRHYRADDFLPLQESEQLEMVDGRTEIAKGVWVEPAPGPTAGHQALITGGAYPPVAFLGVLVPTLMHLSPGVATAFDWNPDETVRSKTALLHRAQEERWMVGPVGCDWWLPADEALALSCQERSIDALLQNQPLSAPVRKLAPVAATA